MCLIKLSQLKRFHTNINLISVDRTTAGEVSIERSGVSLSFYDFCFIHYK